ncbi:MAG TPA: GNAT family N-acetyltransferase [Verrucomicrobiales bacterium]|jgi:RimJ/RimL family protein N-acetyltransferase|nr:GNAT family N-acetyltransferase [Verrucomicrobiales bacterium]
MSFHLPNGYSLSEFQESDRDALVANLQEPWVYEWTLLIPHPYTPAHADEWFAILKRRKETEGRVCNWAVRDPDGRQIGGIGLHPSTAGQTHAAELGYWIAKPWWGRGIATAAISTVASHAFTELDIHRLTAAIFVGNTGSARALEKNGFEIEAPLLRKCYLKGGKFIDAILYARLSSTS